MRSARDKSGKSLIARQNGRHNVQHIFNRFHREAPHVSSDEMILPNRIRRFALTLSNGSRSCGFSTKREVSRLTEHTSSTVVGRVLRDEEPCLTVICAVCSYPMPSSKAFNPFYKPHVFVPLRGGGSALALFLSFFYNFLRFHQKRRFIDWKKIKVSAGNGGNGCVSFRR